MLINMNGPSLLEFDPATVVNHRYFGARTTKHVCDHKNGTDNQYWTCSGNCKRIFWHNVECVFCELCTEIEMQIMYSTFYLHVISQSLGPRAVRVVGGIRIYDILKQLLIEPGLPYSFTSNMTLSLATNPVVQNDFALELTDICKIKKITKLVLLVCDPCVVKWIVSSFSISNTQDVGFKRLKVILMNTEVV